MLAGGLALLLLAALGGVLALRWYRGEQNEALPERRGSSTVEFVPEPPPPEPPPRFVRNEPWPLYGYEKKMSRPIRWSLPKGRTTTRSSSRNSRPSA